MLAVRQLVRIVDRLIGAVCQLIVGVGKGGGRSGQSSRGKHARWIARKPDKNKQFFKFCCLFSFVISSAS
jgi:hypothetical protein